MITIRRWFKWSYKSVKGMRMKYWEKGMLRKDKGNQLIAFHRFLLSFLDSKNEGLLVGIKLKIFENILRECLQQSIFILNDKIYINKFMV